MVFLPLWDSSNIPCALGIQLLSLEERVRGGRMHLSYLTQGDFPRDPPDWTSRSCPNSLSGSVLGGSSDVPNL